MKNTTETDRFIYHLVTETEFITLCNVNSYTPLFFEQEGFISVNGDENALLSIANQFFADTDDNVLVLKIDKKKLEHPGSSYKMTSKGVKILDGVQGPVNVKAINKIGMLQKGEKEFRWGADFVASTEYFASPQLV